MFPGSPRDRKDCAVMPLKAVSQIALSGDDPSLIFIEVSSTAFSGSTITLPNTARLGKRFAFILATDPVANPTLVNEYLEVLVPGYRAIATPIKWRLMSGQRLEFIYGPNGWISSSLGGLLSSGNASNADIAIGNAANASNNGIAIGYYARGSSNGASIGYGALAHNYGSAVGYVAIGYSYGAALGYNSNGNNYGVAIGAGAVGDTSGVAVGSGAYGYGSGVAVGYGAYGYGSGVALGAYANTSNLSYVVALGYYSIAKRYRELVKSADGGSPTLRSWSMVDWYGDTTTATPTELLLGGTASQYCLLLNNSAFHFQMQIIAAVTAAGDTSSWTVSGAIKRGANAASTTLVGTPTVMQLGQDLGAAAWAIAVSADTVNGSLKLIVTGAAGVTIRWNATATLSEVRF